MTPPARPHLTLSQCHLTPPVSVLLFHMWIMVTDPLFLTCRKYESGAVGSFTHLVALQGHDYSCEIEVYADGYLLKFILLR